ncbi:hypothetical protein ILUMI_24769 [Ignelater luminosus]|uniref:Reverse transcriptase domain-containing protein n=1 Tax=Ignelater luminosus TaxID=2038154 RepID=A0A8K0CCV3_IGNLU|nr:hypothetical protein ILUMI_24769 [Ignelater luminosus]
MVEYRSVGSSKEKKRNGKSTWKIKRKSSMELVVRQAKRTSWEEFARFIKQSYGDKQKLESIENELLEGIQVEQDISEDEPNSESQLTVSQIKIGITIDEFEFTMKKLKLGKTAGRDRIAPKMAKHLNIKGKEMLLKMVGNWKLAPVKLSSSAFPDNVVVLADSLEKLQFCLNIWDEELCKRGLKISISKMKSVAVSKNEESYRITLGGELHGRTTFSPTAIKEET